VRAIAFCALLSDFRVHSGAILVILLALYLALFFCFNAGDDIVRQENRISNCRGAFVLYFWLFLPGDFPVT